MIIGVLAASVATFSYTADQVFYDEDRFVETYDSLAADEALRDRVADGLTDQLMVISDLASEGRLDQFGSLAELGIEEETDESDPNALAEVIRSEQRSIIRSAAGEVVNEASFPDMFVGAVRTAHPDVLEAFADDSEVNTTSTGEVYINVASLFPQVQERLADEVLTEAVSRVDVPRNAGRLKVLDKTAAYDWLWDLLRVSDQWASRLIALAVVSLIAAVLVADRRPWVLITVGTGVASVAVLVIVVLYVIWALIPLLVDVGETSDLVAAVYRRSISGLVRNEIMVIAGGIGVAILGTLARWIWPDDWVYEHHDNGQGPVAVRATAPTQQVFPQHPQQGYPQQGYPQQPYPQQPYPQQYPQYPQPQPQPQVGRRAAADSPVPFGSRTPKSLPRVSESSADPGPATQASPAVETEGWDYEGGDW